MFTEKQASFNLAATGLPCLTEEAASSGSPRNLSLSFPLSLAACSRFDPSLQTPEEMTAFRRVCTTEEEKKNRLFHILITRSHVMHPTSFLIGYECLGPAEKGQHTSLTYAHANMHPRRPGGVAAADTTWRVSLSFGFENIKQISPTGGWCL